MKTGLYLLFFVLINTALIAQTPLKDSSFKKINRMTMTYADTLKTDIYFAPERPSTLKSPLVVLVHGGGFYTGKRDGELEAKFAMDMTGRGFVVASIEYHLTRKGKKEGFGCACPADEKVATFRQAATDIAEALDFLLKFSNEFQFAPERVVLAGSSAGAEAVLHAAYAKNHTAFKEVAGNNHEIAAVVSFAGALLREVSLETNSGIPAFFVHGTDDELVPYETAPHHYCEKDKPGYLELQGSASLANLLEAAGTDFALYTAEGGGHEWANKAYDLTDEVSLFLYKIFQEGDAGQLRTTLP